MPGATAGTRFGCSPRPATTRWPGSRSRLRPTRSRPRTRWRTTWRPTRPSSSSRFGPVSASTGSGERTAGSWSRRATRAGGPTTWWSPCRPSRCPGCPPSPPTSVPRSFSSIQPTIATLPSSRKVASWWWERATRAPRSPWRSPAGTRPGWPGKESGHVPFRIEGAAARYVFQPLLFRVVGHRVLTVDTPIGRRLRPRLIAHAAPLVRVKPKDLAAAGDPTRSQSRRGA